MKKMTMRWMMLCGLVALITGSVGCLGASDGDGGGGGGDGYCSISPEQEGAGAACESNVDCEGDLTCERLNGQRVCLQLCDGNNDCDFSICNLPDNDRNNSDNNTSIGGDNNATPNNSNENNDNNDNNGDPPPNNNDNNGDPPPNNNDNNGDPPPNNNDNNGDPPPNNNDNNSGPEALCRDACDKLLQCANQDCPGALEITEANCENPCLEDPETFQAQVILDLTCGDLSPQICPPDAQETDAGQTCTADSDCEGGVLQPFCIQENDPNTGEPSGWDGGYCTAFNCRGDAQCGTGNICVTIDDEGTTACFVACDPSGSASECRANYECPDLSNGQGIGACFPPEPAK